MTPTAHASTTTTYGAGSSTNYGHVKLSDSTTSTSSVTDGIAATPAAVKAVKDAIPTTYVSTLDSKSGAVTLKTASIGSATKGTDISADDITTWTTNTPTVVTKKTVVTGGTTTNITPVTKKTVVTSVTPATVVTGGTTTDVPNVSKKTVVTSVTPATVVTGGTTTDVPNVTGVGTLPSLAYTARSVGSASNWSAGTAATAAYANGILTITDGTAPSLSITTVSCDDITSWSSGTLPSVGTAIKAYTSLTTGAAAAVQTGDSITLGTAIKAYTALTTGAAAAVQTGDSVTTGTSIAVYTALQTGDSVTVTAGVAATLSYTSRTIPNISVAATTVVTGVN